MKTQGPHYYAREGIQKFAARKEAARKAQARARKKPQPTPLSPEERQAAIDAFVAEKGVRVAEPGEASAPEAPVAYVSTRRPSHP